MSDVTTVRQVIDEHFPGLWPAVDLGLSACATLLLRDNANPVSLIYVGGPGSSKTTVAEFFTDHKATYISDDFTPAAFVSQAASVKRKDLAGVDLLPRIRHKVLITPELATIFRGKEEELINNFKIITRVLDGQGLRRDLGTHGGRGYRGDYVFAWIGCTTPIEPKAWKIMAQLGSRLFFFNTDPERPATVEDVLNSNKGLSYKMRRERCKKAVHDFLTKLLMNETETKTRYGDVEWDSSQDPEHVHEWIARCAVLLARMRSLPRAPEAVEGSEGNQEQPYRANAVLYSLARGHALVHGRRQLTEEDLPPVAKVTVSSMPPRAAKIFTALVRKGEPLTVAEAQQAIGTRHPDTARKEMQTLSASGVVEYLDAGQGKLALLQFHSEFEWCASPEFRALLLGD